MTNTTQRAVADYHDRRLEQRRAALRNANRHRMAASTFKKALKTGEPTVAGLNRAADVVLDPPEDIAVITAEALVTSVKQIGKSKARDVLRKADVSPTVRLRDLSAKQRVQLVIALRTKAATFQTTINHAAELRAA